MVFSLIFAGVLEPHDIDMRARADTRGAVADLAGFLSREIDQLRDGVDRKLRRHHHRMMDADQAGDRDEIPLDVDWHLVFCRDWD